jgi:hypothetical protein
MIGANLDWKWLHPGDWVIKKVRRSSKRLLVTYHNVSKEDFEKFYEPYIITVGELKKQIELRMKEVKEEIEEFEEKVDKMLEDGEIDESLEGHSLDFKEGREYGLWEVLEMIEGDEDL